MAIEQEFHAHRGAPAERSNGRYCIPDDDTAPHISQYADETAWTLDVYHDKHAKLLAKLGATPLPCAHADGQLYRLSAQQLIEFIAADAGLNVEFRSRKRAQLSPEALEAKRERMRALRASQLAGSSGMNGA